MSIQFEWDNDKAASNLQKHGVGFDEASTVFVDPLARIFSDEDHSEAERREIIIGRSTFRRLVLVSFVERVVNVIRIIRARQATRKERQDYEENDTL